MFKRSLILNETSRVAGSIDQEYLQQIVREFNRSLTPEEEQEFRVNFEDPVDIAELPDFAQQSNMDDLDNSDDFPVDVSIIYGETDSSLTGHANSGSSSYSLFFFILIISTI